MRVKIGLPLGAIQARDFLVEKSDNWKLVTLSWGDFLADFFLDNRNPLGLVSRIIFCINGSEGEKGTFYIDNLKLINEPIKPSIVKQPDRDGNYLSIDVLGKPVVCQWQKDGVNITAEGFDSYYWSCGYYGAGTYRCIVTNSAGSVVSEPVVITDDQLL